MRGLFSLMPVAAMGFKSRGVASSRVVLRRGGGSASRLHAEEAQAFIDGVNEQYELLHTEFEAQFWGTKMGLTAAHVPLSGGATATYSVSELTRTKQALEAFLGDESKLKRARALLEAPDLGDDHKKTLALMTRAFGCYIMESDEAKALRAEATAIEGGLEASRNAMALGATIDGAFEELSSVGLRSKMRVDGSEATRRACYEGLRTIGGFVVDHGFVDLVKKRNAMARSLGYEDYYDYKVTQAEGFGKDALFEILAHRIAGQIEHLH